MSVVVSSLRHCDILQTLTEEIVESEKFLIMDVIQESHEPQLTHPLLGNQSAQPKTPKTPAQKAIRKTFKGTACLSNHLPTGTVMAFQILSPILTHQGQCQTPTNLVMTTALLAFCSLSCFLLCFTDSIRDARGKVRYGFATFKGLRVMDGSVSLTEEEAAKYRIGFLDFFHALLSILVFATIVLFDKNVVKCFIPTPSETETEILGTLPLGIGIVCSLLFVFFPSRRHGIGFPLSRH